MALSEQVSGALAEPLLILAAAVACVLLVACSTVAVLMLIRATTRQAELATRLAVGASRSDILRLFLVEGCLLTVGATMLGAGVAVVTARTLLAAAGSDINSVARATFGLRVFGLATLAAAGTVLFIGAIPALHAASAHWPDLLRGSPKAGRGRGAAPSRVGRILLTAQIAMSVALLAVCLTLVRTYTTLSAVNPGFEADGVITFRVDLPDALYPVPQRAAFFDRVRDETARLPGVQSAAFAALLPFGDIRYTMRLDAPGAAGPADPVAIEVHIVSAGFLHAMHIPLLAGRDFDSTDSAGGPKVAIISRTLARRCFGTADPVGRTLEAAIGPSSAGEGALLIVGVAGDVKNGSLVAPAEPQVYVPYVQAPLLASATFVARVAPSPAPGDLTPLVASVRDRVRTLDRSVAVVAFRPLRDAVQATLGRQRFNMIISGTFAASGTVLTVVALYAAVLYSATRRRKEFAIRLAVGAGSRAIGWLVVREGLSVIVPGVAIGITGAIALTRALGSLIYGVQPDQIAVLCLTAAVSSVVTLIATWHPAFTATRVDLRATLQSL